MFEKGGVFVRIAILATAYLKEYLEKEVQTLDLDCETELFVYYNYEHIVELYRRLESGFDGFITTGPGPMLSIQKSIPNCKPIHFFLCSAGNYYKTFFEVIYKYQDWNFEYGYFDFCDYLCPGEESSLIQYLREGTFEEWLQRNNRYIGELSPETVQKAAKQKLQKHIDLWNSKKIKYSLSRMSPIMPEILEAGVECYYISFSREDILAGFRQLTHEILLSTLTDNLAASIDLFLPAASREDPASWEQFQNRYDLLEKLLTAFNKKYLCDFIIRDTRYGFRISTNRKTAEKVTDGFTCCHLRDYIRENGGFELAVGYGLAEDLSQAEANAIVAAKESRITGNRVSYLFSESQGLLGLLGGEGAGLSIQSAVTPYMRELADRTGLSTLTVQKLCSALAVTGTEEVTTQELSRVLRITMRSVNRIIAILVKYNLAEVIYTRQTNTKGRPSKVYRICIKTN